MSGFYFTIDGPEDIVVDRGFRRSSTPRVTSITFGDGYSQRAVNGENPKDETFNISVSNQTDTKINNIAAFFDTNTGRAFDFVLPTETIKVVCTQYNITYLYENYHTINATFERVYEP